MSLLEGKMELLISLVSGAIGGNVAGGALKKFDLGMVGNSLAGVVGGGLGGQVLGLFGANVGGGGMDLGAIVGTVASGGVGGGALLAIIGVARNAMGK
jgi:hypothetical protein